MLMVEPEHRDIDLRINDCETEREGIATSNSIYVERNVAQRKFIYKFERSRYINEIPEHSFTNNSSYC